MFGPHATTNRNVVHPEVDALAKLTPVQIFYSDPPWGDGNVKMWATLLKKATGETTRVLTGNEVIRAALRLADYATHYLFLEMGERWQDEALQAVTDAGWLDARAFTTYYQGGRGLLPNALIIARKPGAPKYTSDPSGTHGFDVLRAAVKPVAQPGWVILDPFCGLGNTARIAIETGMTFRGNELNRERLKRTQARLRKAVT